MAEHEPDTKEDIRLAQDRGESIGLMEPLLIAEGSKARAELTDLVLELAQKSAGFRRSLPERLLASLSDLVRAMNCYYSNLIEGHDTHPIDIERALKGDYSRDARRRDLQLEAKAHIAVQHWIDQGGLKGRAAAAAHHRLAWIPPFLDGNGRVARLMSHATLLEALDTGAVWSVARGLARNVDAYKAHLAACDQTRRNDLDGRGHLSEENLAEFTKFFLTTCLDQVTFMERLMEAGQLRARILLWAEEEIRLNRLPPKSAAIIEAVLYRGELARADTANIVATGERQARRVVSALIDRGVLISESTRAPLRLVFPAGLASRWTPGVFPERTV